MNYRPLSIETISGITQVLENLVTSGFGPQGKQTLLSTGTGHVTVTNNGCMVLNSLHFAHPLAKMIIESLNKTDSYCGDGSKVYILYLNGFFKTLRCHRSPQNGVMLGRALEDFSKEIYPQLIKRVLKYSYLANLTLNQDVTENVISSIFRGVLSSQYSEKLVSAFSTVLISALRVDALSEERSLWYRVQILVEHFENFILKVPNLPFSACRVVKPFVIQRDFPTLHYALEGKETVRFVMSTCSIEHIVSHEETSVVSLRSSLTFNKLMKFQETKVLQFIKSCKEYLVTLVLCTEKIPDFALQLFYRSKICVVQYVPEEDVEALEVILGKQAIKDNKDVINQGNICVCEKVMTVLFKGMRCIHLLLNEDLNLPNMLVIAAPSDGLCSQLTSSFRRCLKVFLLCDIRKFSESDVLEEDKSSDEFSTTGVIYIAGGGSFELICHVFLSQISKSVQNPNLAELCMLLSNMLLNVPCLLHKNNSVLKDTHCDVFIERLCDLQLHYKTFLGQETGKFHALGFNRRGNIKDIIQERVAESVTVKLFIFNAVLQILQLLFRIEGVV